MDAAPRLTERSLVHSRLTWTFRILVLARTPVLTRLCLRKLGEYASIFTILKANDPDFMVLLKQNHALQILFLPDCVDTHAIHELGGEVTSSGVHLLLT